MNLLILYMCLKKDDSGIGRLRDVRWSTVPRRSGGQASATSAECRKIMGSTVPVAELTKIRARASVSLYQYNAREAKQRTATQGSALLRLLKETLQPNLTFCIASFYQKQVIACVHANLPPLLAIARHPLRQPPHPAHPHPQFRNPPIPTHHTVPARRPTASAPFPPSSHPAAAPPSPSPPQSYRKRGSGSLCMCGSLCGRGCLVWYGHCQGGSRRKGLSLVL